MSPLQFCSIGLRYIYTELLGRKVIDRSPRVHEWSRRRHKIGKFEVSIILCLVSVGFVTVHTGQHRRDRAKLRPSLLLIIWKRPNFYFIYLTVQFMGCSFLGNSPRSVITQSKSSGYISIELMVMMIPLNQQY